MTFVYIHIQLSEEKVRSDYLQGRVISLQFKLEEEEKLRMKVSEDQEEAIQKLLKLQKEKEYLVAKKNELETKKKELMDKNNELWAEKEELLDEKNCLSMKNEEVSKWFMSWQEKVRSSSMQHPCCMYSLHYNIIYVQICTLLTTLCTLHNLVHSSY